MRVGDVFSWMGVVALVGLVASSAVAKPAATFSPPVPVEANPVVETTRATSPTVASDGTNWLVVYDSYPFNGGWVGRILGPDGQPSGPPFGLGERVYSPQVVFDGETYVLLFRALGGDGSIEFVRVSKTGKVLGEPQLLQARSASSGLMRVVAAAGGSSVLAAVCDEVNPCQTWVIGQDGAPTQGIAFESKFTSLAYSDGTWLVLSIASGLTLRQLDETGALIDGTTQALGDPQDTITVAAAAPAADGFAVAWLGTESEVQLATVDFDGSVTPKAPVTSNSYPPHLEAISGGYALRSGEDLQLLDAQLAPRESGQLALSSYFGELGTNGAERGLFVEAATDSAVEAELLSLAAAPSSLGTAAVSAGPPIQNGPRGAATQNGWLLAWNEYDANLHGAIRAITLDEAGAALGDPFLVTDEALRIVTLSPGPQQYSLLSAVGSWGDESPDPMLELFLVGSDHNVLKKSQVGPIHSFDDLFQVEVAGSPAGWLVAWVGEDGLHATRVAKDGSVLDDTRLAENTAQPLTVVQHGSFYRVFWWDLRERSQVYTDVAIAGAMPAAPPRVLFGEEELGGLFGLRAATSGNAWWFLGATPCTSNACRKRGEHQLLFGDETGLNQALPFPGAGPLVAVDGVALGALFNGNTLQLGLAERGGELALIDSFPGRWSSDLAPGAGQRVLLSFVERATGTWGTPTQRVSVSVVSVSGGSVVSPAGGGGAGGEADGGAGETANDAGSAGRGGVGQAGARPDASTGGDAEPSASKNQRLSSGCGCRTAGSNRSTESVGVVALLAGSLLLRRRRRPVALF